MKLLLRTAFHGFFLASFLRVAADVPAPGLLLPDDTLAVICLPDATIARTQFKASNIGRLWADPSMAGFRTNSANGFRVKLAEPLEKESGLSVTELAELTQGQVTLALLRDGWDPAVEDSAGPNWVLVADAKDRSPRLAETLAAARKRISGNTNTTAKPLRIGEVEFTSVTLDLRDRAESPTPKPKAKPASKEDDDEEDAEDVRVEFAFGQVGTSFVASTSPTALQRLIPRILGTNAAPGLGSRPHFETLSKEVFADAGAWVYLDTAAFYDRVSPGLGSVFGMLALLGADPAKVVPATGIASVKAVGAAVRTTPEGSVADLRIVAPAAERSGLTKVFETLPKEAGVPEGIPATAGSFLRWRIDGKAAWKALDDALRRISPQIASLAQLTVESAGQVFDGDFNLQRDLAGNLGDDFIVVSLPPTGTNLVQLGHATQVQMLGSPNPARLLSGWKAMEALFHMQAGALQFTERTAPTGQKVLVAQVTGRGGPHTAFHLTTLTNYVVVAETGEAMDLFLAAPTNGLASAPGLGDVAKQVGGTTQGVFGYTDHRANMRPTWEALRTAKGLDSLMPAGTTSLEAVQAVETWADFRLLPPFEQVERYWTVGGMGGGSDAAGFRFRWAVPGAK